MQAFYKKMLQGLVRFTDMTRVTISNFGLEKFVASVKDVMVYFKLKHRKLTYNAAIVSSANPASIRRTSDEGFWKDLDT